MKANICLFVTGTIVPNSNFVAHSDPALRRDEYFQNLQFYSSELPGIPLYFLENSEYDFAADAEFERLLRSKNITLLKYSPSAAFSEGKGYQEFEMLDHAVAQLPASFTHFFKVTGRYRVLNIRRLMDDVSGDIHIDLHRKLKIAQTSVFACSTAFYSQRLSGNYFKANDANGIFIETVIYQSLHPLLDSVSMFSCNPQISGISGSYGGTLARNPLKLKLKNAERKILKLLGINEFVTEY